MRAKKHPNTSCTGGKKVRRGESLRTPQTGGGKHAGKNSTLETSLIEKGFSKNGVERGYKTRGTEDCESAKNNVNVTRGGLGSDVRHVHGRLDARVQKSHRMRRGCNGLGGGGKKGPRHLPHPPKTGLEAKTGIKEGGGNGKKQTEGPKYRRNNKSKY